jgi:streptogramin lyase/predicted Ser/Thr protein kinase
LSVSTDPRIGSELLGYRIEALLGRGGMSVVYRAHHVALDRKVALKLLAPELAADERFRERFLRESKLAASLDHPSIVPIYDAGEVDGQLYIAMRYVEGSDLKHLLRVDGALEPRRALRLVAQLGEALDFAHARGLVHRDVKPSNALLDGGEHLYLADFGLTKSASDRSALTATGRILGTVDYAAPEQIEGKPVDGRTDVYSLGCLLYECLTGEVPFQRDSELAVLWAHVNEPPPRVAAYPALDPVIARALAKEPGKRYGSCRELVDAARAALGLQDVVIVRDRRPILLAAAGIAVAFAAVAAGIVLSLGNGGGSKPNLVVANNTLVRIDPETDRIAAVTAVGQGPEAVAVAGDTVWVHNWDDRTVSMIDPDTSAVDRTLSISGSSPSTFGFSTNSIVADGNGAWVLSAVENGGLLTQVRPGLVSREFPIPYDVSSVAVGGGAVWIGAKDLSGNVILRVSPRTGALLDEVRLAGVVTSSEPVRSSVVFGAGAAWGVGADGTLFRVDPATSRITSKRRIAQGPVTALAAGSGAVWALVLEPARGNRVLRIDPQTLDVTDTIPAPKAKGAADQSGTLAAGDGALWWNGANSGLVWRLDPRTLKIDSTIRLTPPLQSFSDFQPVGIAAGAGGVWVTVRVAP